LARRLGADEVFLGTGSDIVALLRGTTDGQGPDIAVEAVGAQTPVLTAIESVRRGGTVTLIGNLASKVEIPLQTVVTRQLRLLGSCASAGEYPECIRLMQSGAIKVDALISAIAPLSEGPAWFERLYAREGGLIKVILEP
jgi:L-iditol 2-dehydrogenase